MNFLQTLWYRQPVIFWPLIPFSILFDWIGRVRHFLYQMGIFSRKRFPVPVIVVGNITVGGTGKTPLVIHIVNLLKSQGLKPGVVSRGYKGKTAGPISVEEGSDPILVGDEPVLLAKRLKCPVIVGHDRCKVIEFLRGSHDIDVVILDDGLQHYALHRDIEIVVIDGRRRFGNGHCLPVGPLRESVGRLNSADLLIANGGRPEANEYDMEYKALPLYNVQNPTQQKALSAFKGQWVHGVAGIANPKSFFRLLASAGLKVIPHRYADHYYFKQTDLNFKDDYPVIMTEKDAVKCANFVNQQHWVLPINATVNPLFDARLLTLLKRVRYG